ncbi:cytochrome P450 [Streptomyces desertarenae]|uniref:Cytochrome P450 n=1 Tax=Streptomyces desertarenae TaxID=2666184 RepID=A0ABW4PTJ3_9ACTN
MTTAAVTDPGEQLTALLAPGGRLDPYPHYEALRAHGDLVTVRPGLMVALGYEECDRALREPALRVQDAESFDLLHPGWRARSSLRGWTESMLYRNPPDHTRLRRLVSGAFTPRRVASLAPAVERMADRLLDRMAELGAGGAPVDFMTEFAYRLPVGVIGELLGVPEDDHGWFRAAAADVTVALEGITKPSELERADSAMDRLSAYFAHLCDLRRGDPQDDLISALVRAHGEGGDRLGGNELVANLVLLLSAGFDTTTHLLGHSVHLAFEHPGHARRLREDPAFADAYVEEALRYEAPVQATSRWAAEDVRLPGATVPAGTKLVVVLGAANRDPRRFPHPERFDPDRGTIQPLSFAAGAHFCLGAGLARLEARLALPRVLRRFPRLAPAGPGRYRDRWLVRGHERLPVVTG